MNARLVATEFVITSVMFASGRVFQRHLVPNVSARRQIESCVVLLDTSLSCPP